MSVDNQAGGRARRLFARGRGGRLDLVVGIVLGVILGIAVAYVLVVVVGSGRDASDISATAQIARSAPGSRGSP